MQLLLDEGFPSHCQVLGDFGIELIRWSGTHTSDLEFLQESKGLGMAGVVFLGSAVLSTNGLVAAAGDSALYIAATWETNPQLITSALSTNLKSLKRAVRPGGIDVIYSREIRPARRWWAAPQDGVER